MRAAPLPRRRCPLLPLLLAAAPGRAGAFAPADGCVVVTGASGFVAGHIVEELLRLGYAVRGTVRDPGDARTTTHLRALDARLDGSLTLHAADLTADSPFDDVAAGCAAMLHVASPVIAANRSDPDANFLQPALRGTLSAVRAAERAGMRAVVVTSSVASLYPVDPPKPPGATYDETDTNNVATLQFGAYAYSKLTAEQAAYAHVAKMAEPFRLATIHFPLGVGPQQNARVTSSNQVVRMAVTGEYPLAPPLRFTVVDVRDVARAHVAALAHDGARGRYVVCAPGAQPLQLVDLFAPLAAAHPDCPVATVSMPMWLMRLVAYFDVRIDPYMLRESATWNAFDGSKISRELGFEYRHTSMAATMVAAAESMFDLGIAPRCTAEAAAARRSRLLGAAAAAACAAAAALYFCCCRRRGAARKEKGA